MDKTTLTVSSFDATAEAFERTFMDVSSYAPTLSAFAEKLPARARVLDLGCGPGNVAKFLLGLRPDLRITGVDLAPAMIERFRKNVPAAEAMVMDLRQVGTLPPGWDAAVAAFCMPFFHHDEAATFLQSLGQLVMPQGHLYLSTMQGSSHGLEKTGFGGEHEFFFNYYQRTDLETMLTAAGFQVQSYEEQPYHEVNGPDLTDMLIIAKRRP
jgi:SAM-dependent methyltransferase